MLNIMSGETRVNEKNCDSSDADRPAAITVDASQGSVRSNLPDASPATPHNPLYILTPDNMGLPLTLPCRIL